MGSELVDDGGEYGVGKAVKRSPLCVAERGIHMPDLFGG